MDNNASNQWIELYQSFKNDLININLQDGETIVAAQKGIEICSQHILILKSLVKEHSFTDYKEEINFFKNIKPKFYSQLIFYTKIVNLESKKPIGGPLFSKEYYHQQLAELKSYFYDHLDLYQYYRSKASHNDQQYFVRNSTDVILLNLIPDADPTFSTRYDYAFSRILANELLVTYLMEKLNDLNQFDMPLVQHDPKEKKLIWTASKISFVEMVYAFKAGGVFNNGTASLNLIASTIGPILGIDPGNTSRSAQELLTREKGLTVFLEFLISKLHEWSDRLHE